MKEKINKFILFLKTTTLFAQVKDDSLHFKLNEYLSALTEIKNFNGNVMISKNGKLIPDKTYNMKGENGSLKVTKESRFIIASVSKIFVKYSIL